MCMRSLMAAAVLSTALSAPQLPAPPAPVDPQRVQDQDDMTWADYRAIPGVNWAEPSRTGSERNFRVALIAVDFPDQPFVITQPKQSDLFGNPQIEPVVRDEVPKFYADFWGRPNEHNHGQTIHGYWMEQSRGKVGIPQIDAYGPYRMPRHLFQYGLNEHKQQVGCPSGFECTYRMEPDVDALWMADAGADIKGKYDIILRIYAGYDETSVWQEFGEMKFASRDDIPDGMGPARSDAAALGADALRAVDLLARRRAAVGPVVCAPGREFRHHHARDRALSLSRPATTTTTRTCSRTAA
jgi:M6 family metalloprotease-like protein